MSRTVKYLFTALVMTAMLSGCFEGPAGPQGEKGEQGEQGEQGSDYEEWLKDPYLLVKRVPNLEALQYFREEANLSELPVAEWRDTVNVRLSATVKKAFEDVLVGISIGPCDSDKIRTVVGDIPLL